MSYLNQEFVVFEDDTFRFDLLLDVYEFNNVYNVGSYDNVWIGWSTTPGGSYILQYANSNWDQGILGGNVYSLITQNFTGGTPDNYAVSPTSVSPAGGFGAILTTQVNSSGVINSAVCSFTNGGHNYAPGDVLTFAASLFGPGTSQDLKITLDSSLFPLFPESNTPRGTIQIFSPEGPSGPATIKVLMKPESFEASSYIGVPGPLQTGNTYYWEVVVGEHLNYNWSNYNSPTQVVATGTMYVSGSMFSNQGLRP